MPGVLSPKKVQKQGGMLAFLFLFLRYSAFMVSKNHLNLTKKLPKVGKNGGLGWLWGLLGELLEALGPQDGPKFKKGRKMEFVTPPQGASWEPKFDKNVIWRHFVALKSMSRIDT